MPLHRTLPVGLLMGLALVLSPLTPLDTGAAGAQELPYQAVVALDNVPIRSGAGRMYYEVGTLNEGDVVTVEDELFGWYKIRCPEGVYSFVERKNVDQTGDGSTGRVNTGRTQVYAAHATKGPADSYRSQTDLDAGETVKIIGEVGNVYRIVPPDNVYVFLPPASVTPKADALPPAPVEGVRPEPETLAKPEITRPSVVETVPVPSVVETIPPTVEPVKPEPRVITPAEVTVNPPAVKPNPLDEPIEGGAAAVEPAAPPKMNSQLALIESMMSPYFDLPVEEQPITKLVQAYANAAALEDLSPSDLQLIQDRLATIERNRELANALNDMETMQASIGAPPPSTTTVQEGVTEMQGETEMPEPTVAETGEGGAEPTDEGTAPQPVAVSSNEEPGERPTPIEAAVPIKPATSSGGTAYDAVGILTASTVHNGSNQPELLRLVDPTARRTIAYIEPGGPVDTLQMLGKLVGIVGSTQYDPTTRLRLIAVDSVEILGATQ